MKRASIFPASALLVMPLLGSCGSPTESPSLRTRWYVEQVGNGAARPAVAGDTVFFSTGDGRIIARARASGVSLWEASVGSGAIQGANLLAHAGVVVAPVALHTAAVDAASGRELWRYSAPADTVDAGAAATPGQVVRAVLDAANGTVYIPAWGASVSAVDSRTGATRWVWTAGRTASDTAASGRFRSGASGVTVVSDTVYVSGWHYLDRTGIRSETWLIALDARSGSELWRKVLPSVGGFVASVGSPIVWGDLVLVSARATPVWAVHRATHEIVWTFAPQVRYSTFAAPVAFGDFLYVDSADDRFTCLELRTGAVRWTASLSGGADNDPLVTDRRVYLADGPRMHVLDRISGNSVIVVEQPRLGNAGLISSSATAADGRVFVTVSGGAWSFDEP